MLSPPNHSPAEIYGWSLAGAGPQRLADAGQTRDLLVMSRAPGGSAWPPRHVRAAHLLLALTLLASSACMHHAAPESADEGPPPSGEVTFRIVNHGRMDLDVFVVHSGVKDRLGQSTASLTATFKYNMRRLSAGRHYYLLGDPIGSPRGTRTELLVAQDGQLV